MPYNTTAIPPRQAVTGAAQLPLARVKKIIAMDQDIAMCSNNAAFVITLATEMFIQYLAEQGHNVVKSERKPRKNIQYRDLAGATSRIDTLEFLSDIIPQTVPFKQVKEKRARDAAYNATIEAGQTTLDGQKGSLETQTNGHAGGAAEDEDQDQDPNAQLEMEIREARGSEGVEEGVNGNGRMSSSATEDVEMS